MLHAIILYKKNPIENNYQVPESSNRWKREELLPPKTHLWPPLCSSYSTRTVLPPASSEKHPAHQSLSHRLLEQNIKLHIYIHIDTHVLLHFEFGGYGVFWAQFLWKMFYQSSCSQPMILPLFSRN